LHFDHRIGFRLDMEKKEKQTNRNADVLMKTKTDL
jgi:hypothetical protein